MYSLNIYIISVLSCLLCALGSPPPPPASSSASNRSTLSVVFYYMAWCGDTHRFMNQQLMPTYQQLGEYIHLELVPWGRAQAQANGSVSCFFGPKECDAHRLQACIFNNSASQASQIKTVQCMANIYQDKSIKDKNVDSCIEQAGLDLNATRSCAASQDSMDMMLEFGKRTKKNVVDLTFFPAMTVDGTQIQLASNKSYIQFKPLLCAEFQTKLNITPPACQIAPNSADAFTGGTTAVLILAIAVALWHQQ